MIELDKLEAAADAATPGPWSVCQHLKSVEADSACTCGYRGCVWGPDDVVPMAICQPGHDPDPVGEEGMGPQSFSRPQQIADSQFIAAANPAVIKELIALVRRQEKELATERSMLATSEALRARHAWIPVGEKLPPRDEYVWASWTGAGNWSHDAKQGLARHIEGLGWQPMHSMGWEWNVTHWMPLPPSPVQAKECV